MYLKQIIIKNFQIHKELIVNLKPGFNVIVGDTGKGKSSIIRVLSLLLQNKPRGGEKIYQNRFTKDPIDITLIDSNNNKIRRTKRKYYINNEKPLKAFGSSIPEIINKIIPLKDVNWQRQLEQHFLILNTSGNAAKILNSSSGMEDQELIIKEIKEDISSYKSDIKRLFKNNEEHKSIILKLGNVKHFYMKAKAIEQIEKEYNNYSDNIKKLSDFLIKINEYRETTSKYKNVPQYLKTCNEIIESIPIINSLEKTVDTLSNSLNKINEIQKIKKTQSIIEEHINNLNDLLNDYSIYSNYNNSINTLQTIINNIKIQRKFNKEINYEIKEQKVLLHKMFKELSICPLCEQPYNKGKHSC